MQIGEALARRLAHLNSTPVFESARDADTGLAHVAIVAAHGDMSAELIRSARGIERSLWHEVRLCQHRPTSIGIPV